MDNSKIERVSLRMKEVNSLAVLTGAGISAESGVPTFRGNDGLWKNYRAEELATPQAFNRDPQLVWEWYDMRRRRLVGIEPNPAHYALAKLEERVKDFTLITQNVDGLHQKSGSRNILELHGNIWKIRCTECGTINENNDIPIDLLPHCKDCNGLVRPHIVWFGEMLPEDILTAAYSALERCKMMLIVGTSGVVQPAASMAYVAKRNGAYLVEVNLERTPISEVADETIIGKAAEILPVL